MKRVCNSIGVEHCGREIADSEAASESLVHINFGGAKRNEWRTVYQCQQCAAKDAAMVIACGEQATWLERRRANAMGLREAANALGLLASDYSSLERLRAVASPERIARFDAMFPKLSKAEGPESPSNQEETK